MPHVMLDLETLGTSPGCPILSIGAVEFSRNGIGRKFHQIINVNSCHEAGLVTERATYRWWLGQPDEAQRTLTIAEENGGRPLGMALYEFGNYLKDLTSPRSDGAVYIWGNGADFDQPVLGSAYRACGFGRAPWDYFNSRCYRTLKNLRPDVKMTKLSGIHHNAVDDAETQAIHTIMLLRALGVAEFQEELPVAPPQAFAGIDTGHGQDSAVIR